MSSAFSTVSGVESVTVMRKLPFATLPCESVAEQCTAVVPVGNVLSDGGEQSTVTAPSTTSAAVATNGTAAPEESVAFQVISDGTVSDGVVVSCTVTVKVAETVLRSWSAAVQVTFVLPNGNVEPLM